MKIAGSREYRVTDRSLSGPGSTRATSPSLTSSPFPLATVISANWAGVFISPRYLTENSRRSDSILPAGISTLRVRIADSTSCAVSPRAASSLGESHTRIAKRRSPKIGAPDTPGIVCIRGLIVRSAMSDSSIRL